MHCKHIPGQVSKTGRAVAGFVSKHAAGRPSGAGDGLARMKAPQTTGSSRKVVCPLTVAVHPERVGASDGRVVGASEGTSVTVTVGDAVNVIEGATDGNAEGCGVG